MSGTVYIDESKRRNYIIVAAAIAQQDLRIVGPRYERYTYQGSAAST